MQTPIEVQYTYEDKKYIINVKRTDLYLTVFLTDILGLNEVFLKKLKIGHLECQTVILNADNLPRSSNFVFNQLRDRQLQEIIGLTAGFYKKIIGLSKLEKILLFISKEIENGKNVIFLMNAFSGLENKEIEKLIFVLDELFEQYHIKFVLGSDRKFTDDVIILNGQNTINKNDNHSISNISKND
ncbi:hypothetical protein M153_5875000722, partial [Pseudoloma neurophilia]